MSLNPQQGDEYIYNLVLLGQYGVGKTTLMNMAVGHANQAEGVAAQQETKGKAVENKSQIHGVDYRILQTEVNDSTVRMKIFDTGDMERYQQDITSGYYRYAHLALLLYDITDHSSFKSLQDDWLEDANSYCPKQCKKVVVANKMDRAADSVCDKVKVKKWAAEHELLYEELSAVNKDSVDRLFMRLAQHLLGSITTSDIPPGPPMESCCGIC